MHLQGIIILLLCISWLHCSEVDFISPSPNNTVIIKLGSTVKIPCKWTSVKDVKCAWTKSRSIVAIDKDSSDENYGLSQVEPGDCSILLKNANPEYHNGVWQCRITDVGSVNKSKTSAPFKVAVVFLPEAVKIEATSNGLISSEEIFATHTKVTVKNKSMLKLQCSSCCGMPKPMLTWKLGPTAIKKKYKPRTTESNQEMEFENKTWSIERTMMVNVQPSDDHLQIGCSLRWGNVDMPTSWFSLNVTHHPESLANPINATARKYGIATLKCPLSGNPKPSYDWFKRQNGGDFSHVTTGEMRGKFLYLYFTQDEDAGVYKCVANNTIDGEEQLGEALINLQVVETQVNKSSNTNAKKKT